MNEIKEFAKAFKLCRLSLGLTQSQVGNELYTLNGPCYSQSAICRYLLDLLAETFQYLPNFLSRFEKLDITPKSAKKIKPVLENWMREAEEKRKNGTDTANSMQKNGTLLERQEGGDVCTEMTFKASENGHKPFGDTISSLNFALNCEQGKKRKRRTSFTPAAIDSLNKWFEKNQHPNSSEMTEIAECLNYERDVVRVWFCNKRQALKAKKQNTGSGSDNPGTPDSSANNNHPASESHSGSNQTQPTPASQQPIKLINFTTNTSGGSSPNSNHLSNSIHSTLSAFTPVMNQNRSASANSIGPISNNIRQIAQPYSPSLAGNILKSSLDPIANFNPPMPSLPPPSSASHHQSSQLTRVINPISSEHSPLSAVSARKSSTSTTHQQQHQIAQKSMNDFRMITNMHSSANAIQQAKLYPINGSGTPQFYQSIGKNKNSSDAATVAKL